LPMLLTRAASQSVRKIPTLNGAQIESAFSDIFIITPGADKPHLYEIFRSMSGAGKRHLYLMHQ
jgi:hypothetical protein